MGQEQELTRVSDAIAEAIMEFRSAVGTARQFRCEALREFVTDRHPSIAPDSPSRVLRHMRRKGMLNYMVISRSSSLYQFLPTA